MASSEGGSSVQPGTERVDTAVAFEEEKEKEATLKALHKPIRKWFSKEGTPEEIKARKEKYGKFPLFWQDFKTWEHEKAVYQLYQQAQRKGNEPAPANTANADKSPSERPAKRRKKSRWASAAPAKSPENGMPGPEEASRWSAPSVSNTLAGGVKVLPSGHIVPANLSAKDEEVFVYKLQLENLKQRMASVPELAAKRDADPDRSPSPEPTYNTMGVRTNNRERRMMDACKKEEERLMVAMLRRDPELKQRYNFKIYRKVYMPVKDFPEYNFIGLVLGPRGATQRQMEEESGCKIAIRGRGSVKDGRQVRQNSQAERMLDDDLHVLITGDDPDKVALAVKLVKPIMNPLDDDRNVHKQRQLRQLALINGTLRENDYCNYCGEAGHRNFECPKRQKDTLAANKPTIKCSICGESSHVTADCKYTPEEIAQKKQKVDGDFQNFMADLGDASAVTSRQAAGSAMPNNASGNQGGGTAPQLAPILQPSRRSAPQMLPSARAPAGVRGARGGGPVRGRGRGSAAMMKPAWMVQQEAEEARKNSASGGELTSSSQEAARPPSSALLPPAQNQAPSAQHQPPPAQHQAPPPLLTGKWAPPPTFVAPPFQMQNPQGYGGYGYPQQPGMLGVHGAPPPGYGMAPPSAAYGARPPNHLNPYAPPSTGGLNVNDWDD